MSPESRFEFTTTKPENDFAVLESKHLSKIAEMREKIELGKTVLLEQIIEATTGWPSSKLIETTLRVTESPYKIRTEGNGAYVSLCLLHAEKTPSLFMYPSKKCLCRGCGYDSNIYRLMVDQEEIPMVDFFEQAGINMNIDVCREVDVARNTVRDILQEFRASIYSPIGYKAQQLNQ